jgi:hypothetical protein
MSVVLLILNLAISRCQKWLSNGIKKNKLASIFIILIIVRIILFFFSYFSHSQESFIENVMYTHTKERYSFLNNTLSYVNWQIEKFLYFIQQQSISFICSFIHTLRGYFILMVSSDENNHRCPRGEMNWK